MWERVSKYPAAGPFPFSERPRIGKGTGPLQTGSRRYNPSLQQVIWRLSTERLSLF